MERTALGAVWIQDMTKDMLASSVAGVIARKQEKDAKKQILKNNISLAATMNEVVTPDARYIVGPDTQFTKIMNHDGSVTKSELHKWVKTYDDEKRRLKLETNKKKTDDAGKGKQRHAKQQKHDFGSNIPAPENNRSKMKQQTEDLKRLGYSEQEQDKKKADQEFELYGKRPEKTGDEASDSFNLDYLQGVGITSDLKTQIKRQNTSTDIKEEATEYVIKSIATQAHDPIDDFDKHSEDSWHSSEASVFHLDAALAHARRKYNNYHNPRTATIETAKSIAKHMAASSAEKIGERITNGEFNMYDADFVRHSAKLNRYDDPDGPGDDDESAVTTNTAYSLSHFAVSYKDADLVLMFRNVLMKRICYQLFFGYEEIFGTRLDYNHFLTWNQFIRGCKRIAFPMGLAKPTYFAIGNIARRFDYDLEQRLTVSNNKVLQMMSKKPYSLAAKSGGLASVPEHKPQVDDSSAAGDPRGLQTIEQWRVRDTGNRFMINVRDIEPYMFMMYLRFARKVQKAFGSLTNALHLLLRKERAGFLMKHSSADKQKVGISMDRFYHFWVKKVNYPELPKKLDLNTYEFNKAFGTGAGNGEGERGKEAMKLLAKVGKGGLTPAEEQLIRVRAVKNQINNLYNYLGLEKDPANIDKFDLFGERDSIQNLLDNRAYKSGAKPKNAKEETGNKSHNYYILESPPEHSKATDVFATHSIISGKRTAEIEAEGASRPRGETVEKPKTQEIEKKMAERLDQETGVMYSTAINEFDG